MKNSSYVMHRYAGWAIICALAVIPVIRWFQINSIDLALTSGYTLFSMVGRITGLVGLVLYALNFVLATRFRFLEDLFGGLNRVYIAHHIVGGLALILLLIHPLALALRYVPNQMQAAAEFLLPFMSRPLDWPVVYGMIAFQGLVVLLIITFFVRLPYNVWLFTHRLLGIAFFFGGLHAMFIPSDTSADTFMRWYILGIAGIGMAAYIYRSILPRVFVRREKFKVIRVERISDTVTRIHMQPIKKIISYKPGQFVFIRFKQPSIKYEFHPFTISSAPDESGNLTLTVKNLGDFTGTVAHLHEGAVAEIEGAFGRFTFSRSKHTKQIWVAGGIGITPFLSMAKSIARTQQKTGKTYVITLFHVVKNQSELVDADELRRLSAMQEINFTYIPYVDEGNNRITASYISSQVGSLAQSDVYICGPPGMMKSIRKQCVSAGVKNRDIYSEEFALS